MSRDIARLTDRDFWDDHWAGIELPQEVRRMPGQLYLNAILDVFDRFLPRDRGLTAMELGGAPGKYLAYVHRTFGYRVACLDYSATGCEATRTNMGLLGIPADVYHADIFDDRADIPTFDVVYSLGLIEHFADPVPAVTRHVQLLKPGGFLILGVPNFLGINLWFLSRLAPQHVARHELHVMDLRSWRRFERRFGLDTLFKGYIGGLEPLVFHRREGGSGTTAIPYTVAGLLRRALSRRFRILRRLNGRLWSGYAMAVYRRRH